MTKTTLLIGFILFLTGCGDNNTKTVNQKKEPIISVNFINNYEADVKGGKLFLKVKADNGIISGFISDDISCLKYALTGFIENTGKYEFYMKNITYQGQANNLNRLNPLMSRNSDTTKLSFIKTSETLENFENKCLSKKESRRLKTARINAINVLKFPETKPSGKAWDNMMSSYKPDLFIRVYNKNNDLIGTSNIIQNCKNDARDLRFEFGTGIIISDSDLKNGLKVVLLDEDSVTSNDTLGALLFKDKNDYFDDYGKNMTLNQNKIEMVVYYKFM